MNHLKTKPNMLQQDFHRGSNPAYDKVAFVAEHYDELVYMYQDILEKLKAGSSGGGCNYLKHTYSGVPIIVGLGDVTMYGYDTSKPNDMEIIRNSLSIPGSDFNISKPMYAEEFKQTVKQSATPKSKYLLNLFTENEYSSFLDKCDDESGSFHMYAYGFSTKVSRIENGVVYDTENNPINYTYSRDIYTHTTSGDINEVANEMSSSLPDTVKCLVLATADISSINNNYIVGYSDTLYSDYNSAAAAYGAETISKEITLNNVFIFPCNSRLSYKGDISSYVRLFSKDRTMTDTARCSRTHNLISVVYDDYDRIPVLSCSNLLSYKNGLMYKIQSNGYKCDITDNYSTDPVMRYS